MGLIAFAWRNRLLKVVLPYALIVLGLVVTYDAVPVVFSRPEAEPTPVTLTQFDPNARSNAKWLKLNGGGYFVSQAIGEGSGNFSGTDTGDHRRFYVPILTPSQANAWTAAGNTRPAGRDALVVACLTPSEFKTLFPRFGLAGARAEGYRLAEFTGTIAPFVPRKVNRLLESHYGVDADSIHVFQLNAKPLSSSDAFTTLVFGVLMLVSGGVWVGMRLKDGVPDTDDNYVPPVPEMPEGGWTASNYRKAG